jgi:hypothetical protein
MWKTLHVEHWECSNTIIQFGRESEDGADLIVLDDL